MKPNKTTLYPEIPYISLCGKEINFLSPVDRFSSICFKDLDFSCNKLLFGGTLQHEFKPELLAYNPLSGRIYHRVQQHRHLADSFGLLHPHTCQKLGERITLHEKISNEPSGSSNSTGGDDEDRPLSWTGYVLDWGGVEYPLEDVQNAMVPSGAAVPSDAME